MLIPIASPPFCLILLTVSSEVSKFRSTHVTVQPSLDNLSAIALPIPCPAPVTKATLFSSIFLAIYLLFFLSYFVLILFLCFFDVKISLLKNTQENKKTEVVFNFSLFNKGILCFIFYIDKYYIFALYLYIYLLRNLWFLPL